MTIAFVIARRKQAADLLEGTAVPLGRDGRIFRDVLRRNHGPESDLEQALRETDCPPRENEIHLP